MKTRDIATELDKAFAAARVNALMGGVVMGDTVDPFSRHSQSTQSQTCRW